MLKTNNIPKFISVVTIILGCCDLLRGFMHSEHAPLMKQIDADGAYDDTIDAKLKAALIDFKQTGSW